MSRVPTMRRAVALGVAVVLLTTGLAFAASVVVNIAVGNPGFALAISPQAQNVAAGRSVSYTVTLTPDSGFSGTVKLTAIAVPVGVSATISPSTLSSSSRTATMTVSATPGALRGTFPLVVLGQGSKGTRLLTASVTVKARPGIEVGVSPPIALVSAGQTAAYQVALDRTHAPDPAALTVTGLPPGAAATFTPNPAPGTNATLTVTTDAALTPDGTSTLTVAAIAGPYSATATARLTVYTRPDAPFEVRGNVSGLAPGVSRAMNLALTNRFNQELKVTALHVAIASVSAPNATPSRPCSTTDFSITQFSGTYPLRLPAQSTRTLSDLGVAEARRPKATMLNRAVNQDGCKGATLTFTYGGTATR